MVESHLSLKALRTLYMVGQTQSFSAAAEVLNVTPAAVQQLVRGLESNIDKVLVIRDGRSLKLTELAKTVLNDLHDGFQLIERASTTLKADAKELRLMISVEPTLATLWLIKHLDEFRRVCPKTMVLINASNHIANLEKGEADIALRFDAEIAPGLIIKRLFSEEVIAVCSPLLIEGSHELRCPEDLKNFPLIHFDWPPGKRFSPEWSTWLEALGYHSSEGCSSIHFNDYVLSLQAAIAGQGVCLASSPLVGDLIDAGMLISPFCDSLDLGYGYDLVVHESSTEKPHVQEFINWAMSKVE